LEQKEFRKALGSYATGVTVITTVNDDGDSIGITANSFSSLSLDPPLVLWSIAKSSSRFRLFECAGACAIHVLSSAQEAVSKHFTTVREKQFEDLGHEKGNNNILLLTDYLARFQCTVVERYEGGDHSIIVCRVDEMRAKQGRPLLFAEGRYQSLSENPDHKGSL